MSNGLLLAHLLEEFLVEVQLKIYSVRTRKSAKNNNALLFLAKSFKVINLLLGVKR